MKKNSTKGLTKPVKLSKTYKSTEENAKKLKQYIEKKLKNN